VVVDVGTPLTTEADAGALGYLVGRRVKNGVPCFRIPNSTSWDIGDLRLKALGAAMAASGAVALYHIEGLTPEATAQDMMAHSLEHVVVDDLAPGYAALNGPAEEVDLVSVGCPHSSLAEIEAVADYLQGRRAVASLWITTARATRQVAESVGLVSRIEEAGGRVVADTCMVVAPIADLGFRVLATNSAKMALYSPPYSGLSVRFGSMEQCLDAAVSGRWRGAG
jgi:predicted aconitase